MDLRCLINVLQIGFVQDEDLENKNAEEKDSLIMVGTAEETYQVKRLFLM